MRSIIISNRKLVIILSIFICLTLCYVLVDNMLILDHSNTTIGEYDFGPMKTETILSVEGTGIKKVNQRHTWTELKIIEIKDNTEKLALRIGDTIKANEYLDVIKNRTVSGIPLIPGRSVYGMGTGYKSIGKNERRIVHIFIDKNTKEYWIIPDKFL
jgi:hypothetical protein